MKYKNTLRSALVIIIILGAVVIGYFAFNRNNTAEDPSIIPNATENSNVTGKPGVTANPNEINKDINLTNELDKEKIVELGQIYKKGDIVYGAIVVKETANKTEARKLGEKYFNKIKKQYKGTKINVQVVRDGENICIFSYGF